MNIRTKILTVAALLAVWSCAEKEITPTTPDGSKPIEFGSLSTRALVNSIDAVNEFGVSCAISNADNSDYGSIMDNVKVERSDKSTTGWDYNPKRYWLEDSYFYFAASYPYVDGGGFQAQEISDESGVKYIAYTLAVETYDETTKNQLGVDILTASEYVNTCDPWNNTVNLNFRHLLTNVNFEITQDVESDPNNHYYITGVSLYGISTSGTYAMILDHEQIYDIWNLQEVNNDISFDRVFDSHLLEANRALSVWGDDGLLLLPQDIIREKVKLKIDYLYQLEVTDDGQENQDGSDQEAIKQERSEIIDLPATDKWKSGNKVKYTLSFAKPTKIVFKDITVKKWGTAPSGGTIIIK